MKLDLKPSLASRLRTRALLWWWMPSAPASMLLVLASSTNLHGTVSYVLPGRWIALCTAPCKQTSCPPLPQCMAWPRQQHLTQAGLLQELEPAVTCRNIMHCRPDIRQGKPNSRARCSHQQGRAPEVCGHEGTGSMEHHPVSHALGLMDRGHIELRGCHQGARLHDAWQVRLQHLYTAARRSARQ